MSRVQVPGRWVAVVASICCAALLGAGAVGFNGEWGALQVADLPPAEKAQILLSDQQGGGWSIFATKLALDDCSSTIYSIYGDAQPTPYRRQLVSACLQRADGIAARYPSYSYAWFLGAQLSADLGDRDGMNERLVRSQMTGANEQWVAAYRVELAAEHYGDLQQPALGNDDRDISLLIETLSGIASIADRYTQDPAFRTHLAEIVATLSPADQARFVAAVTNRVNQAAAADK